ncbi:MAG: hypothetical protein EZS28_024519, partial [Streblomastix strix]
YANEVLDTKLFENAIQTRNIEIKKAEIVCDCTFEGESLKAEILESQFQQLLAQKLLSVLNNAVLDADKVISVSKIMLLFRYLRKTLNITIEESLITYVLLQRFVSIQAERGIQYINKSNIGTMLVVLVIVTLKNFRDKVFSNSFFAQEFGIPPVVLNQSESAFLRIISFQLWVEQSEFIKVFNEIVFDQDSGIILIV